MSENEKKRLEVIVKAMNELPEAEKERAAGIIVGMALAEKTKKEVTE